jgi:hypothetical protein
MKTLREYIDQLDEISRRDFLKGLGAAAVAGAGIGSANAQDINLVQKQYDWQFADTKGKDTVVDIIKRTVGGKVAITARKQYFLIYNWDDIKSKVPKGFDPGPYGLVLMAVSKDIQAKKDYAKLLFLKEDFTQKEIAIKSKKEIQKKYHLPIVTGYYYYYYLIVILFVIFLFFISIFSSNFILY